LGVKPGVPGWTLISTGVANTVAASLLLILVLALSDRSILVPAGLLVFGVISFAVGIRLNRREADQR
jgi:hypothetical protein